MSAHMSAAVRREALTKPWNALQIFQGKNILSRLPEHYKKFYWEWQKTPKAPVHYVPEEGNWKREPNGEIKPVQKICIKFLQPKEIHEGIWGGEAIIKGFYKRKQYVRRMPRYWVPTLKETSIYSEILDRYMNIVVTERTLSLIDEHYGFDNYILNTPPADLMSELALKLRREMLLSLAQGTLYSDNPGKKEDLLNKYCNHIIPIEEAEWFGLTIKEAATKQKNIEAQANVPVPLKESFRQEFVEYLKTNKVDMDEIKGEISSSTSGSNWISSLNPFGKK
ncbi:39S ribosomal protein L28, mitochondrial-like [Penaeus japonicus]|uniref:39S ribosomal protein L28, mitochondrial-like n=1 Tax=Penaeus japonicus TaxID=27405 RepID=UPI001C7126D5|nr:39S ribosomal protein L28, mitochondrial-like [Penaeus japonicus]XP_042884561.1 39S ribosomal protein L28, mitochondrial-like [Penaeus japonicus]